MTAIWTPAPRPSVLTWSRQRPGILVQSLPALGQSVAVDLPTGVIVQGLPALAQSVAVSSESGVLVQSLPALNQAITVKAPILSGTWAGYLDADWQVTMDGSNVAAVGTLDGSIGAVAGAVGPTLDTNWLGSGRRAFQFNGTTQYLTANAFAALASGDDLPFAIAWQGSLNNTNVTQDMWGLAHSSGTGTHEFRNVSSTATRALRTDDAGTVLQGSHGGPFANNAEVVSTFSFSGTAATLTYNGVTAINAGAQNSGVCTLDRFAIGAVLRAVAIQFMQGRIRRIAYRTTQFSPADVTALQGWLGT